MEAKADCLLKALSLQLKARLGDDPLRRFIPYVQMYEFEGLLLSDPEKLAVGLNQPALAGSLRKIRDDFGTPEEINNSPITAPSKRIENLYSGYDKPIHGSLAAIEMGLDAIRVECKRFNAWLTSIEALSHSLSAG